MRRRQQPGIHCGTVLWHCPVRRVALIKPDNGGCNRWSTYDDAPGVSLVTGLRVRYLASWDMRGRERAYHVKQVAS
jgi:hypothetical protein